jgi:hypothetical protein
MMNQMWKEPSVFACALVFSPVRMAGQTACPEGSLARARKYCGQKRTDRGDGIDGKNPKCEPLHSELECSELSNGKRTDLSKTPGAKAFLSQATSRLKP